MELGLPLALRLVQRVCGQGARQVGGRRTWRRSGGGCECRRTQERHVGWWKEDQVDNEKHERPGRMTVEVGPEEDWREGGERGRK